MAIPLQTNEITQLYSKGYLTTEIPTAYAKALCTQAKNLRPMSFTDDILNSGTRVEVDGLRALEPFALLNRSIKHLLDDVILSFTSPLDPPLSEVKIGRVNGRITTDWLMLNQHQPMYLFLCPLTTSPNHVKGTIDLARNRFSNTGEVEFRETVASIPLSASGKILIVDAANILNSLKISCETTSDVYLLHAQVGAIN